MKPKVEWERDKARVGGDSVNIDVGGEYVAWFYVDFVEKQPEGTFLAYFNGKRVGTIYGKEKHVCKAKPQVCITCGEEME